MSGMPGMHCDLWEVMKMRDETMAGRAVRLCALAHMLTLDADQAASRGEIGRMGRLMDRAERYQARADRIARGLARRGVRS